MKDNLINELFNTKPLSIKAVEDVKQIDEFRPNYKRGSNNIYSAVVKFLPNPKDPINKSIVQKYTVYLKDPITKKGKFVDDPSSIGEDSVLTQMFFTLRNGNQTAKNLSKNWGRHREYASLVQIISDAHEPKLVGKILVWRYGMKVHEKILDEMTASVPGLPAGNPFDLFDGKLFLVQAIEENGYNNFDKSKFIISENYSYPKNCMIVNYTDKKTNREVKFLADRNVASKTLEKDNFDGKKFISEYLEKNAPDLSKYEYHPWTEDIRKYVQHEMSVTQNIIEGKPVSNSEAIASVSSMPPQMPTVSLENVLSGNSATPVRAAQQNTQTVYSPVMTGQIPSADNPSGQEVCNGVDTKETDKILNNVSGQESKSKNVESPASKKDDGKSIEDILSDLM